MVLPRHQDKGGAPKISALERAKLLLGRKGVGNLPALAPDQELSVLSCPPSPSHGKETCDGFIPAKAPKQTVGSEDTGGHECEKGTRSSYSARCSPCWEGSSLSLPIHSVHN